MSIERLEQYIRSRRSLELSLHAIRPSERAGMVHQGARFIILSVPDSVLAAFNKIPEDRTAFGYLDQYVAPERVLARVSEYVRIGRGMGYSSKFAERYEHARKGHSFLTRDFRVGRELLMKVMAAKRGITETAQGRAALFLTEYVTDRPNLRGSTVFEIEQTAFALFRHLPDELIDFCQRNKACEETYRTLDPWVGMNLTFIKTEL